MRIVVVFVFLFITGCSTVTDFLVSEASKIEITYDKDEATEAEPIDSIRITRSFYWLDDLEKIKENTDYDIDSGSVHVWYLENDMIRRNEVKFDTTIYIYKR